MALAVILAVTVGLAPPVVYYLTGYASLEAALETSVHVEGLAITRLINNSPETWRFQERLLNEVLAFNPSVGSGVREENVRIVASDGHVILEAGEAPPVPILLRAADLLDSGEVVARIETAVSLRPLLLRTAILGALGLALGLAVFALLRWLPMRTIDRAFLRVQEEAKRAENALAERAAADSRLRELNAELERRVTERTLELEHTVARVERQNRDAVLLAELSGLLQSCQNLEEAGTIVGQFCAQAYPQGPGAVYLVRSSRNSLDRLAAWGEPPPAASFAPEECWAMRRGRTHSARGGDIALACAHARPQADAALCIPLNGQDGAIGLLHLEAGAEAAKPAQAMAEQLALALGNLQLRETLREQSIRDALTGLHNRRYLEESLEREIARAKRSQAQLAVFMLDADHFKGFNDQHGHEAGDEVLRALGRTLKGAVRASDLACRFGGEEFTVVLVESDVKSAREWAGRLAADLRQLEVKHAGNSLPKFTLSMGLAMYPAHGADRETLLQAADLALYEAKHAGRDCLAVAGEREDKARVA